MKRKKYRELNLYSYYDHAGIARHLEDMARQGWQLEKAGSTFFTYHRCDPAELHYAVVYFPKASQFDPEPPAEQREFWELCKATGWELVTSRYQMQIFCNPAKDPTPIETDPVVQVENVRAAMKKGAVRGNWVLLICSCLQIWLQFRTYSIRDFLTQGFALSAVLIWLMLGIDAIVELTAYYRWYRKAKAAAREEGILLSPRSRKWLQILRIMFLVVIVTIDLPILFLDPSRSPSTRMVILVSLFCYAVLLLIIYGSRQLMKKKGFSAEANMGLNILIAIVGTFVLMGGLIWMSFRVADDPSLNGHQNAETISYTRGYRTYTYDFYRDPIPLSIEDLTGAELDPDYSRQMDVRGTPLLTKYDIRQRYPIGSPAYAARRGLRLEYTIWEVGAGFLYEPVKNSFFKDTVYTFHGQIDFVIPHGWVAADAAPWGALDAYQYHDEDGQPYGSYLLCYDSRFVEIFFDAWNAAPPTAEQMTLVGKVLGSGPLS
ncbi:MAG: DUF2812 domain-containing protein [Clostridiales bacterium]|nr:DUF2812 domain-containing protein [Clostridiales bacterium]MBD9198872.1 DUF2812 domain-containing protein [Clostridiales bacterium]